MSIFTTGKTDSVELVKKASSAFFASIKLKGFSLTLKFFFFKILITVSLVTPFKILVFAGCVIMVFELLIIHALDAEPSVIFPLSINQDSKAFFSTANCLDNTLGNKDVVFISLLNHLKSGIVIIFTPFLYIFLETHVFFLPHPL